MHLLFEHSSKALRVSNYMASMVHNPGSSDRGVPLSYGILATELPRCSIVLLLFCSFFSCLHDRATVRSGAKIGLLSLRLSVSQGASLGDFLLAPVYPIEKVTH